MAHRLISSNFLKLQPLAARWNPTKHIECQESVIPIVQKKKLLFLGVLLQNGQGFEVQPQLPPW